MFSYYGSKSKLVNYYPKPKFDKIIEPFAGSARYSLKYFERDVLLVDKYEVIINIWKYLQEASENDILSLPEINYKQNVRDIKYLTETEKDLIGFCVNRGNAVKVNIAQKFNSWTADKKRIASQLFKIKHWQIKLDDYRNIKNEEATWFIDPPYIVGGYKYKYSEIDYKKLAEWSKSRFGQAIVCENTNADWLPFKQMAELNGIKFKTTEVIWSNLPTEYDWETIDMFAAT